MAKDERPAKELMGADIRQFDIPKQFEITTERILLVRDDLTFVINDKFNRISAQLAPVPKALERIGATLENQERLIKELHERLEQPWWLTAIGNIHTQLTALLKRKK